MRQDELVTDATPILLVQPEAWAAADPDASNRALLVQGDGDVDFLGQHFSTKLQFGTAGLRAPRGLGPARMNRVTVRVTARAIGLHLMDSGLHQNGVVIGYDARPDSDIYALDTALLLTKLGVPCLLINDPCPTPVVVWHQKMRAAAGAIVVTASHNPAEDSGYKVYGSDGIKYDRRSTKKLNPLWISQTFPVKKIWLHKRRSSTYRKCGSYRLHRKCGA